jgi:SpoIID/LytB domain protein
MALRRLLGILTVLVLWAAGLPAATAADGDLTFNGRGFGHGRGMSQWGAYGYSVDLGADSRAILDHYYGGTSHATNAGNPQISVELLGLRGRETLLTGPGLTVNGIPLGRNAVRVRGVASNTFEVLVGDTCAGPWTLWTGAAGGRVGSGATVGGELRLCELGSIRAYRGTMVIVDGGGFQTTVNTLAMDDYLRGVLPREMPASWGSAGGGRGMEALEVQAVAARSYALSSQWTPYARTCDSTACQVYTGAYTRPDGGAVSWIEDGRTDTAVFATTGQVRRRADGSVARTEFSASSGGWTAGGEFPAVEDRGDATAANPNRSWSVTLTQAQVAAALGVTSVSAARVTQRNGLGADGGRVLQIVFDTSSGQRILTGEQARTALGLKSSWFTINSLSTAQARAYARSLYLDVLGHPGDEPGIGYWTAVLLGGADRRSVAYGFAASDERYRQLVHTTYVWALRRAPDPGGANVWVNLLARGGTLNDLNAGIYGSPESLTALGRGDVRLWVEGVYQGLLARGANSDERNYWAGVAAGSGRSAVALAISTSAEARDRRLGEYYRVLLGRAVDEGGRSTFAPMLAGRGDFDVVAIIAASDEYRARAESRFPDG